MKRSPIVTGPWDLRAECGKLPIGRVFEWTETNSGTVPPDVEPGDFYISLDGTLLRLIGRVPGANWVRYPKPGPKLTEYICANTSAAGERRFRERHGL